MRINLTTSIGVAAVILVLAFLALKNREELAKMFGGLGDVRSQLGTAVYSAGQALQGGLNKGQQL